MSSSSDTTISYSGMTGTTFGPFYLQKNGLQFTIHVNTRKSGVQWVITFRRKGQNLPESTTVISRLPFDGVAGKSYDLALTAANFPLAPWSWTDPTAAPALNTYDWDLIVFQASDNSVHGSNAFVIGNNNEPPGESIFGTLKPAGASPDGTFAPATLAANGLKFSITVPNYSAYLNVSRVVTFRLPGGTIQPEAVISQFEFAQTQTTATYTLTAANFPNAPWDWNDPTGAPALGVYAWEFVLFHPRDYEIHAKTSFMLSGDPNAPAGPLTIYGSPTVSFSRNYLAAYGLFVRVDFADDHSSKKHFLTFRRPGHDIESESTISRLTCPNTAGTQAFFFSPDNFPKAPWDWADPTKAPVLNSFEWELVLYSEGKKAVEESTPLHIAQTDTVPAPNSPTNFAAALGPGSLDSATWVLPANTGGIQKYLVRLAWVDGTGHQQHQDWNTPGPTDTSIVAKTISTAFAAGQAFTVNVATNYPGAPDRCLGPTSELSGIVPGVDLVQASYDSGQFAYHLRPNPNPPVGGTYTCVYQALFLWSTPTTGSLLLNLGDETTPLTGGLITGSVPVDIPDGPARLTVFSQKIEGNMTTRSPDSPASGVICITGAPTVLTLAFDAATKLVQFTFRQPLRVTQAVAEFFAVLRVFTPDAQAANGFARSETYYALKPTTDANATGFRVQSGSGDDAVLAGTIDGTSLEPTAGFELELHGAGGPPAVRSGVTTCLFVGPADVSLFNAETSVANVKAGPGVYGGAPPTLLSVVYGETGQGTPCLVVDYDPHAHDNLYYFFLHSRYAPGGVDQYGPEYGWVPYAPVTLAFARPIQATDEYTLDSLKKTTTQDADGNTVPMKSPTGPNPPAKVILAGPLGLSATYDATAAQIQLEWHQDSMFGVDAFQARLTPAIGDALLTTPGPATNSGGKLTLTIAVASVPGFDPNGTYTVSLVGLGNAYPEVSTIEYQIIGPLSDSVALVDRQVQVSNPVFTGVSVDASPAVPGDLRLTATWLPVANATGYVLQVYDHVSGPGHAGNYQRFPAGSTTGSVDFLAGSADRALIIAFFGTGNDTSSDPVEMLVDAPAAARLEYILVGQDGFGFRASWTPLSDPALPYRVELGTDAPAPFWDDPLPLTAPGASRIEPGFQSTDGRPVPNCSYTVRVRAMDEIPGATPGTTIQRSGPWTPVATAPPYRTESYGYDARGRLLAAGVVGDSVDFTYDERANLIQVTTMVSGDE